MTEITKTEISIEEFPVLGNTGTAKRRARVYIRDADVASGETLNLATYINGVADIEGIVYETDDGAVATTASTWSTSTLTVGSTGVYEACVVVTFN